MTATKAPKKIMLPSTIRVKKLAQILNLPVTRVIKELIRNNIYATINEEIDYETAAIITEDLGYEVDTKVRGEAQESAEKTKTPSKEVAPTKLETRPPVIAVMGHVDHGKTTLLDYLRKTNVAAQESGGITQHIGAYQIKYQGKEITFLDTPGHEAFETMRERGAHLTDIAVLLIAADDGVKPQTKEAIKHIRSAKIPFVVAINKTDKPEAKPNKVKQELAREGVQIAEWGGEIPTQEISAKTGKGVAALLKIILTVAEKEKLKAPQISPALGTVIESHLSAERGAEVTVLVQSGIFKTGDRITASSIKGKIKRMEDFRSRTISKATPSMPVRVIGFPKAPPLGSLVHTGEEDISQKTEVRSAKEEKALKEIAHKALHPKTKKLNLVIKTDTHGSKEAILENLAKLSSKKVAPFIVKEGVGEITGSDVIQTHVTHAKLMGFRVKITPVAQKLAKQLGININIYNVIYELTEAVRKGLEAMLEPQIQITELGSLEVLAIFRTEKDRMIVGGKVTKGTLETNSKIRVKRKDQLVGQGVLGELQSGKQKAEKVKAGQEAGIKFLGNIKIETGDILEFYREEKKKATL